MLRIYLIVMILLILAPALLQALVWTPVNLLAAVIVVAIFIVLSLNFPKSKWLIIAFSAFAIAVPPYPNWLWASNEEGWHFRLGYKITHLGDYFVGYLTFFAIGFFIFWGLFTVLNKVKDEAGAKGQVFP